MPKRDLFSRERGEIERARTLLKRARATKAEISAELETVVSAYERSLRRAEKITTISDKEHRKIAQDRDRLRTMRKIKVANGVYWIEIPDADLRVLCGCPADAVKLLIKRGLIVSSERDGATFETGPNAILLSDVMIQNGQIANLAEFPVLQMLYRQGMLLPNHPNNTGAKPILIGLDDVLRAQSQYIYRGNYGLVSERELKEAGLEPERAREMMRLKKRFAFDSIKSTDELIELKSVDRDVIPLKNDVFLHRLGVNLYEFIWEGQRIEVDLNLGPREEYESSYQLGDHRIEKQFFSVVHIGEGDGWDVNRPCMGSLLTYQDCFYLIDAGPKVMTSLTALGISINEIDGIFHTHAHDDHFAGLAALLRSDRKPKYYATPLVRASVTKKLSALMSIEESSFYDYFEVCDLVSDIWNDINGLETMPIYSPHPVETNIFRFRVRWQDGYKSYAHLADIASCSVLADMVTDDPERSGLDQAAFDRAKSSYLIPADLKKIDIGGGLIHGDAADFDQDRSAKILLAHTEHPLTEEQREIGSGASFGTQDVLIRSTRDTIVDEAYEYLRSYYPDVPAHEILAFTNYEMETFNAGTIIYRKGDRGESIYLVIRGAVEALDVNAGISVRMTAGSIVGEISGIEGDPISMTYRAASYLKALKIPLRHYADFIRKNDLLDSMLDLKERISFLQSMWLFEEAISYRTMYAIAGSMREVSFESGASVDQQIEDCLFIVATGKVRLIADDQEFEILRRGDVCGEACLLLRETNVITAVTIDKTTGYTMPHEAVDAIPIVHWKLLELLDRRVQQLTTHIGLEWRDEYMLDGDVVDAQHRALFTAVKAIYDSSVRDASKDKIVEGIEKLIGLTEEHFETEERLLESLDYPDTESHASVHRDALERLEAFQKRIVAQNDELEVAQFTFLKNWLVNHLLVEDAGFRAFMER